MERKTTQIQLHGYQPTRVEFQTSANKDSLLFQEQVIRTKQRDEKEVSHRRQTKQDLKLR